ncbi:MAG: glycosyltransferase family 2 protein [Candidatus Margulisbacteria bacterium]|jgi:glycosyltransferase involved in cell wall biosynthesis|nr:glycosyltransferase family 2 protein [Candidatus Margulisiibacteriota bacterium]
MTFKPCLVVPVYNHAQEFSRFVKKFPENIPLIIIDDGNAEAQALILQDIASRHKAELIRLPQNSGKCAALLAGFRRALALRFTHALQIDADGQHNYADIPEFLALGKTHPDTLLLGAPEYGADAPASRRAGRHIANFFLRLETGDRTLQDAMCGFRLYPLKALEGLINKGLRFPRMGGDIEFLVKAKWLGLPHLSLKTQVKYPPHGLSNFRIFHDNVEITLLNTYLCTLAVLRLFKPGVYR